MTSRWVEGQADPSRSIDRTPPAGAPRPAGGASLQPIPPVAGAGCPPLDPAALEDIAAGLASIDRRVPASPTDDRTTPRPIRLIATANYDVWLITWPPGSEIGHHDHAQSTSVVRMVSGSLIESVGSGQWALQPGTSVVTPPRTPHQLWNAGSTEATSLHVYSPPLTSVTYHPRPTMSLHPAGTALPGTAPPRRSTPVRSRRAEATGPLWSRTPVDVPISIYQEST